MTDSIARIEAEVAKKVSEFKPVSSQEFLATHSEPFRIPMSQDEIKDRIVYAKAEAEEVRRVLREERQWKRD